MPQSFLVDLSLDNPGVSEAQSGATNNAIAAHNFHHTERHSQPDYNMPIPYSEGLCERKHHEGVEKHLPILSSFNSSKPASTATGDGLAESPSVQWSTTR